ncbi:MAG: hypothetical protein ACI92Z_000156 [Paracoccaceae bacterium]|jgi:hypothetical protein
MRMPLGAIILGSIVIVAGCSDRGLRQLRSAGKGPEEFSVMPVKPLTKPENYTVLPTPTPGGINLVDIDPRAEAIVALGGRAPAQSPGAAAADAALVNQASRYGVPSNTRVELAETDAAFRKRKSKSIFSRLKLGRVDHYGDAYSDQALDPFVETQRFRGGGALTPSSPPASK